MFEEYISAIVEGIFLMGMVKTLEVIMRIIYKI